MSGCSAPEPLLHPCVVCLQSNARKGGLLCLAATAVALATPGVGVARPPDLLQVGGLLLLDGVGTELHCACCMYAPLVPA